MFLFKEYFKNYAGRIFLQSFFYITLFCLTPYISNAQVWEHTFGGAGSQQGNQMRETYDNGFAILGTYYTVSTGRILLIKTDINGNILWTKNIGDMTYINGALGFDVTKDGGFVISGMTTQYDSMGAAFVIKLDECGDKQWCRIYGLPNEYDRAEYIHQLTDGNYIVYARDFGINSPTADRVGLMKLDSIGNIVWFNDYSHYYDPDGFSLVLTNDNGFLITGDCYVQTTGNSTGPLWNRTMVIKIDSTGSEQWNFPYQIASDFISSGGSARQTTDGGFLTLCTHRDSLTLYKSWTYLFKTDNNGNVQWGKQIGDSISNGEWDWDILHFNDSESVILSQHWDTVSSNSRSYKILKIDSSGNILDSVTYGYDNRGDAGKLEKARDGKILMCATKYLGGSNYDIYALKLSQNLQLDTIYNIFLNYDSLCSTGITTSTITLDTVSYVRVPEVKEPEKFLVYPNPVSDNLTIEISSPEQKYLSIYNVLGEKCLTLTLSKGEGKITIDVSRLHSEVYFVEVGDGRNIARKKFVRQ